MDRRLWTRFAVAATVMLSTVILSTAGGCQSRSPQPTFDPFLNRATIPPPPTGSASGGIAPAYGAAPAYPNPGAAPGAAGAYPPSGAPLNPAQPYGPQSFGTPPAVQYAPPQTQAPAGGTPYTPPGGYNYQNQYRQGAANDVEESDSPLEERTGRRQVAARNNYDEVESAVAFVGNSNPAAGDRNGVSQVRWAGGVEDSSSVQQPGAMRTVSYESAVPAGNQGNSTLRFVENGNAKSKARIAASPARGAIGNTRFEEQMAQAPQPTRTASFGQRTAELRVMPTRSIVTSSTNEVEAPAAASFPAEDTAPVQPAAVDPPHSTARFAHDAQYQWLNGRLEFSQLDRRWKLRYIEIDGETDGFGGSVILADASALEGFRPGEFVTVRGVVDTTQTRAGSFAPAYRLQQIQRTGN
jgi:hypothetical protein